MARLNRLGRILGKKDYYQCPNCGYILPKDEAKVSGWDSEHSLRIFIVLDVEK